ncbi:MAG TPA: hypothetical protein VJR02_07085 [Pyrinomonadaceae bacterium]|nr:hypothetical protein [Pyrinomonadaceae bacterium]
MLFRILRIGVVIALAHTVAHNFPGRSVGYAHPELRRRGDQGRFTASTLRFVSNANFRVVHPQSVDAEQAERVLNILESGRTELLHRVSAAGIQTRFPNLEIVINETTGDFVGRTRMPPWAAAYNFVKQLIRVEGENKVWKRLADRAYSVSVRFSPP